MKLLRTIRFDGSDEHVFSDAAGPDEWAVSGAFAFADLTPGTISGKPKQAFSNGFLGLQSFGRSTFASVAEASEADRALILDCLAAHFIELYGAPDRESALAAAREEIGFVADLCADLVTNTIFTVRRVFDDKGEIREEFRTIRAPTDKPLHSRIWQVVDDETEAG